MEATLTIALAGNPNVGKSTIFNALTGARQHVGNWPGKTVERREGVTRIEGREALVVDLPGIYSLTAYSMEEIIARDFIIHEHPSVVVAVVDASNLERNLYLVTQLLEMETPVIIALNMSDLAERRGLTIDPETLSAQLGGVPVIATVGTRCVGIDALKEAVVQIATQPQPAAPNLVRYSERLEAEIEALRARIAADATLSRTYHARWLAIKLLENDDDVRTRLENAGQVALLRAAGEAIARVAEAEGEEPELLIADRRYLFVSEVVHGALTRPEPGAETLSDRIDHVVTHRILGLPIFLLAMWVVFQFTANVSAPTVDWIDRIISGPITHWVGALTGALGLGGSWIESLLLDGVIAGVGGVMVFVPVLIFLFIAIAVLEDSGYMARAALVMDRYMRMIGLHGKSFLPLLVGFGCTVPAVYATRTLESEDDRKLTGFLVSFMSCGARLPVYAIFGAAFFGAGAGNLVFAMYALGIGVAIATGLLIRRTVYRNKPAQPFVIELPPYRMPNARNVLHIVWQRTKGFLHRASTLILACAVVIWFLLAIPAYPGAGAFSDVAIGDSLFGAVSKIIAPVFAPAGFDHWEATGALITGMVAKEVIVGTLNQVYLDGSAADAPEEAAPTLSEEVGGIITSFGEAVALTAQEAVNIVPRTVNLVPGVALPEARFVETAGEDEGGTALEAALTARLTPLAAVAFNVFVLLYVPCMATISVMRLEFGRRWTWHLIAYNAVVAWVVAVAVFQIGTLLGLG